MTYNSPLTTKYASEEIQNIFNDVEKFKLWRRLWVVLAESQQSLGAPISDAQIQQLKKYVNDINLDAISRLEAKFGHDIMAHIHAFGEQCPEAAGIIHLGATSCYVTDNADLIIIKQAFDVLLQKLKCVLKKLDEIACKYDSIPCISFTHYQAAQPTTVGRRFALWAQDFLEDLRGITRVVSELKCRGTKGTVGTQTSFLVLFNGDKGKVNELNRLVTDACGFDRSWRLTTQTYPRKQDITIMQALAQLACSANKFAVDLRLLAHDKEISEPFSENQIGSSAMPHKQNPILCERICGLSRFLINLCRNSVDTSMNQWLERSLDDSSNRKLAIPEAFLTADSILNIINIILDGVTINETVIQNNLHKVLPFMFVEPILMMAVKKGGNRQKLHHILSEHCHNFNSSPDELLGVIRNDPHFVSIRQELDEFIKHVDTALIGLAPEQIHNFFIVNRHLW